VKFAETQKRRPTTKTILNLYKFTGSADNITSKLREKRNKNSLVFYEMAVYRNMNIYEIVDQENGKYAVYANGEWSRTFSSSEMAEAHVNLQKEIDAQETKTAKDQFRTLEAKANEAYANGVQAPGLALDAAYDNALDTLGSEEAEGFWQLALDSIPYAQEAKGQK
jgi:hypothetical protein